MFEVAVSPVLRVGDAPCSGLTGDLLARAMQMAPGPESMRLLAAVEVELLDDVQRVDYLRAWERAARWVAARQQEAVVAVAGRKAADRDDFAREHVRVALVDCGGSPRADVDVARRLVGPLRTAHAALSRGELSFAHARVLARETEGLAEADAMEVAAAVLSRAGRRTAAEFRRMVRRAVIAADPVRAEREAGLAAAERAVQRRVDGIGRASLLIEGPALAVASMWTAIDALADRKGGDDDRNRDQRRFDAVTEVLTAALDRPDLPQRRGARPVVNLFADLPTWAGVADNPVEIEGFGPVPAGTAREAFLQSRWRVVVCDALTGLVQRVGDSTYLPSPRTSRHLAVADRGCLFPGCPNPVHRCDADHGVPYADGGCTDEHNCGLVCRRHHRLKTFTRWRWRRRTDGTVVWRDPTGREWQREPTRYLVPQPAPS